MLLSWIWVFIHIAPSAGRKISCASPAGNGDFMWKLAPEAREGRNLKELWGLNSSLFRLKEKKKWAPERGGDAPGHMANKWLSWESRVPNSRFPDSGLIRLHLFNIIHYLFLVWTLAAFFLIFNKPSPVTVKTSKRKSETIKKIWIKWFDLVNTLRKTTEVKA